jgi:pimeloyl-ACP methyl ester carboxylesterase
VVFLHGISSGAASWLQVALTVGKQHRVLAWDAPGYGASTPLAMPAPRASDYAERLHALLQAEGIARCVLVAHSLGALMAGAYAHGLGRNIVQRVVLISPAGGYGQRGNEAASERVRTERRGALAEQGVAGIAARIANRLLSPAADATARALVQWNAARLHAAGYLQAVELLAGADLGACAPLACPVEVHCGDADVVTSPTACSGWASRFDAPFSLIPNAGHASHAEQPEAVAQIVLRALSHQTSTETSTHG